MIQLLITDCVMLLTMEVVIVVTSLSAVCLYLFVLVRLLFILPDFHKWYLLSAVFILCHTVEKRHFLNDLSSHKFTVSWNNLVWLRKIWNSLFYEIFASYLCLQICYFHVKWNKKAYVYIHMQIYLCIGIKVFINIGQISHFSSFFFTQLTYMLVIAIFGNISEFSAVEGKCSPILVLVMDY